MKAVVMKAYFVENDNVKQEIIVSPSKRAVTAQLEKRGVEILKQTDVTDSYRFTIEDVIAGKLTQQQKELLKYILTEAGVKENGEEE